MHPYPILVNIQRANCLVVGGGAVGTRKVATLLECGATVTVVSPVCSRRLRHLADQADIHLIERAYRRSDLQDMFLVIAATDNPVINQRVGDDARRNRILCNIADQPERSNFTVPSIIRRGDLTLTISTGGKSPAMAKRIRRRLEHQFGDEYGDVLKLLGRIREALVGEEHAPRKHKRQFETLIDAGLLEMVREKRIKDIDDLLQQVMGDRFTYANLMTR